MEAFIDKIKETESNYNIIKINFNLLDFEGLREYHALYQYIEDLYDKDKVNYVFIDEVQMCEGFEKTINSLHASEKYDIYISGSNAFLLSSDLATLFTGRTYQIEVFPFSFVEYIKYFNPDDRIEAFEDYLKIGGISGAYIYDDLKSKYNYLNNDVFNSLVVRDVLYKYKIRNQHILSRLIDFLMDNIGNITSIRSITKVLNNEKLKITDKTVSTYIGYLIKAFSFYAVPRYDIQGKKYLTRQNKYYLADHAFRYARLGLKNINYGRTLENIIAIELLRRKYEIYSGTLNQKEIDFIAVKQNEKLYIQVSDDISRENTFQREVEPLLKIEDAYPKILITHIKHPEIYEGIYICDVTEFLFNDKSYAVGGDS